MSQPVVVAAPLSYSVTTAQAEQALAKLGATLRGLPPPQPHPVWRSMTTNGGRVVQSLREDAPRIAVWFQPEQFAPLAHVTAIEESMLVVRHLTSLASSKAAALAEHPEHGATAAEVESGHQLNKKLRDNARFVEGRTVQRTSTRQRGRPIPKELGLDLDFYATYIWERRDRYLGKCAIVEADLVQARRLAGLIGRPADGLSAREQELADLQDLRERAITWLQRLLLVARCAAFVSDPSSPDFEARYPLPFAGNSKPRLSKKVPVEATEAKDGQEKAPAPKTVSAESEG